MINVNTPMALKAHEILLKRIDEWSWYEKYSAIIPDIIFEQDVIDGYKLIINKGKATVYANSIIEFIAGTGELIRRIMSTICSDYSSVEDVMITDIPRYKHRMHYMPGHFGNAYEVAWPTEMERLLEDLALFGANGYADWTDPNDMPDPYNPHVYCSSSMTLWKRKKMYYRYAKELGMTTGIVLAHNVAFLDQLRPDLLGVKSSKHKVQGQVLCPSIPEARRICLNNFENLMKDFKASEVYIDRIILNPYDDGGCACDKCQPYYQTFLGMAYDIFDIVKSFFPDIIVDICGWWTSDDDIHLLKEFAKKLDGHFGEFMYSVTYGVYQVPEDIKKRIDPLPVSTFVHIGFSDVNKDTYIKTGIHNAQKRIQSIVKSFDNADCTGFNTYNESFGDHYNQYIISRLARNPNYNLDSLTREYIIEMFALKDSDVETLLNIMNEMQYYNLEKAENWENQLLEIKPHIHVNIEQEQWLFEHILIKAQLMALDAKIGDYTKWNSKEDVDPVMHLIEKREKLFGYMFRRIYGLGIMRHAFIPERMQAPWYGAYIKFYPKLQGNIIPGMNLSKNA